MFKRLTTYLKNSPFQKKIIIMAMISGLIPLLVLTFFSFTLIQHFVTEREKTNNVDNLNAAVQQLEGKLGSYQEALTFLTNNNQLIKGLALKNPTNFDQYDFYINDVVPLFKNIMYQQGDIESVTLFTSLDFYNHGEFVKQIVPEELTDTLPLNQSAESAFFVDPKTEQLYLYSQLFSTRSKDINIIVFKINGDNLFKNLAKLSNDPYSIELKTPEKQIIYQFSNETKQGEEDFLTKLLQGITQKKLTNTASLKQGDWTVEFSRPYAQIYKGLLLLILVTLGIFIIAYLILGLFTVRLSKSIVSPLQSLAKEMEDVPTGHFEVISHYEASDEIGQLYQSYQYMLDKINVLINEVYEGEIAQKQHELRALQSQINPHFFYNSLSLINNKAIMTGNEEISEMARLLSHYYRLSLNSGKHTIPLKKELEMTVTYATIQQKMHDYSFDLETKIDEELADIEMINLLIQPFVENAIFHGIDHITDDRKGKLTIIAEKTTEHIQFKISDNGAGMTDEQVANILDHQSKHYGLQNVQQRIRLYYGKEDSITCHSVVNEGTTFTIILPQTIA